MLSEHRVTLPVAQVLQSPFKVLQKHYRLQRRPDFTSEHLTWVKGREAVPFSADYTSTIAVKVECNQFFLITAFSVWSPSIFLLICGEYAVSH